MDCWPVCVSRFVLLPSGSLQIRNVSLLDRGSYRCLAAQNFNHLADQVTTLKWKWSREAMLRVLPGVLLSDALLGPEDQRPANVIFRLEAIRISFVQLDTLRLIQVLVGGGLPGN